MERKKHFEKAIAGWEKVCGGLSSGSGCTADLGLKRLLDGAQLVLNYRPVFSVGCFMWTLTLSPLCTALSAVLKRRIRLRSVHLSSAEEHSSLISRNEERGFGRNDLCSLHFLLLFLSSCLHLIPPS